VIFSFSTITFKRSISLFLFLLFEEINLSKIQINSKFKNLNNLFFRTKEKGKAIDKGGGEVVEVGDKVRARRSNQRSEVLNIEQPVHESKESK